MRTCPACSQPAVPFFRLLLGNAHCAHCGRPVQYALAPALKLALVAWYGLAAGMWFAVPDNDMSRAVVLAFGLYLPPVLLACISPLAVRELRDPAADALDGRRASPVFWICFLATAAASSVLLVYLLA